MRAFQLFAGLLCLLIQTAHPAFAQTVPYPPTPLVKLAVNPVTNKVYTVNEFANTVSVLNAATGATATVAVGSRPQFIAVNPATNRIYVNNAGDATLTIIDGANDTNITPSPLAIGSTGPITVNAVTNVVYIVRLSGPGTDEVTYFNGNDNTWYTIATGSFQPNAMAVNPVANTLFVTHYGTGDVRIVSGAYNPADDFPLTTSVGAWSRPFAIAANPITNKAYVITEDARGPIGIIDGATRTGTFPPPTAGHASGPKGIAVNPVTNKIYAAFENEVIVIDGATNAYTYIPISSTGGGPVALGINTVTNKIYVAAASGPVTVINGDTNAPSIVANVGNSSGVGVNPITNKTYVFGPTLVTVNGSAGDTVHAIPLTTTIAHFPGDTTTASPTFALNASSSFSPNRLAVRKVYYQLDSTGGGWTAGSGNGPWTAPFTGLANGPHTLYAFAADGQDAPGATGAQSNPLVGAIASYAFTVGVTKVDPSVSVGSSPNPSTAGQSVTFTASVSGSAGVPTGTVDFRDGATSLPGCSTVPLSAGSATCTTSALSTGGHPMTVVYSGDASYNAATSSTVTQTVNPKVNPTVSLGSSPNPSTSGQSVIFTASVSGSAGAPTGTVNFRDGATSLSGCSAVAVSAGSATCTTSTLSAGTHSMTAVYSGNATYNAATSSAITQTVNTAARVDPTVTIASSANPSTAGQNVTFTAMVSGAAGTPTGTVDFRDGATSLAGCSAVSLSAGGATCATSTLSTGTHSMTAVYSGDSSYSAGTSTAVSQTVQTGTPPPTGTNVALAANGGVASASSVYGPGLPASAVNNGERAGANWMNGSGWNDATPGAYPDWVQVDFNGLKKLNTVVVYTLQDAYNAPSEPTDTMTFTKYGNVDFTVQAWDGTAWVVLGAVTGNNLVKRTVTFAEFTTDKIRVEITRNAGVYSHVTEIEAFGVPAGPVQMNVALAANGGVASASSEYGPQLPASAVNNGERAGANWMNGSGWNDATPGAYPDWVQVAFNGPQKINRVVVYTLQDAYNAPSEPTDTMTFTKYGNVDFTVQGWDGSAWVVLATVTGNNLVKRTVTFPDFTTDKVRVEITRNAGVYSHVTELEAWGVPSGITNVALAANGGVASASSVYGPQLPVEAVNNGERAGANWMNGSGWNDATPGAYPDWVQINFAGAKTIDRVVVYTLQDAYNAPSEPTDTMTFTKYGNVDFTVQGWDGSAWVILGTVTGNNLVKRTVTFTAFTTDRIRVNITKNAGIYSHITELEAWGS